MATKDPITCHVLDTMTGRPAEGIKASLTCTTLDGKTPVENSFVAQTNNDGRITKWKGVFAEDPESVENFLSPGEDDVFGTSVWKLKFATGEYYGVGKTFWPEVELTFYVKGGEHYHVPLLLGPYSYTTYRGS
jgi:5-hydroxyisourate hydrolase